MAVYEFNNHMVFILIYTLMCAIATNSKSISVKVCSTGWVENGETCYKRLAEKLTWDQARNKCQSYGSHLVVIPDEETSQYLAAYILIEPENTIWIGINDHSQENDFIWQDSSIPVDYTDWAEGHPQSLLPHNKTCSYMKNTSGNRWFDGQCEVPRSSVCEKSVKKDRTKAFVISQSSLGRSSRRFRRDTGSIIKVCTNGTIPFDGACYSVLDAAPNKWEYFKDVCLNRHTFRALPLHIDNEQENKFIYDILTNGTTYDGPAWLPLKSNFSNGKEALYWSKYNAAANFTNFKEGRGDFKDVAKGDNALCIKMVENGKWDVERCSATLNKTVCKEEKIIIHVNGGEMKNCETPTSIYEPCSDDWIGIGDKCFKAFLDDKNMTWDEANQTCNKENERGSLASLTRDCLFHTLKNKIGREGIMWIGLKHYNENEELKWINGDHFNVSNWFHRINKKGNCVNWEMDGNGRLYSSNCGDKMNFICEAPRGILAKTVPSNDSSTKQTTQESTIPETAGSERLTKESDCNSGFIAGITAGIIAFIALIIVIVYFVTKRKSDDETGLQFHNVTYDSSSELISRIRQIQKRDKKP